MTPHSLSRRDLLAGSASLLLLSACGGGSNEQQTIDRLSVRFPTGFNAPSVAVTGHGPQRFPFLAVAEDGFPMTENVPETIAIDVIYDGETVASEIVPARGVGQVIPFYPLIFTPEETGTYLARTDFAEFDIEFLVVDRDDTPLFHVGDTIPPFQTPTLDDPAGVKDVCTRAPEPCPFHDLTLEEAVSNGKPTAMLIATPAFCQTDVCGPNVEWLVELASTRTDINVVHVEVYEDFNQDTNGIPTRAPMLEAWDIAFEPSLFIIDGDGTLVDALHFAFDRDEMEQSLSLI